MRKDKCSVAHVLDVFVILSSAWCLCLSFNFNCGVFQNLNSAISSGQKEKFTCLIENRLTSINLIDQNRNYYALYGNGHMAASQDGITYLGVVPFTHSVLLQKLSHSISTALCDNSVNRTARTVGLTTFKIMISSENLCFSY